MPSAVPGEAHVQRTLKERHLSMIAIGGSIGTVSTLFSNRSTSRVQSMLTHKRVYSSVQVELSTLVVPSVHGWPTSSCPSLSTL